MRLYTFVAAVALASASLAAHADTFKQSFTASGMTSTTRANDGSYYAFTTAFAKLNPAQGTLNSITIALSGTALNNSAQDDSFFAVSPADLTGEQLASGDGLYYSGPSTFPFSANGSDSFVYDLQFFTGSGTEALGLSFRLPTTVLNATGTITYNYTAAAAPVSAATPEPSSFALLGTGLLGVAGAMKRRFA